MELWGSILDIVSVLTAALLFGVLFERLKQSAIVGFLLAGTLLGPAALNLVHNEDTINALSELGVALLLFAIGLEFSWQRLRKLGAIALGGGTLQIIMTGALVAGFCMLFGTDPRIAIAVGAIAAPSSTACVLRALADRAELDSVHGRTCLGILLLQDMAIVPLVLLIKTLGGEGTVLRIALQFGFELMLAVLLAAVFFFLINYVLPLVFDAASLARNRELPILLAVTLCLTASWAANRMHLSPALGAFVAGVLLAESPYAVGIRADVSVFRTVFVTMFFASIGMLADLDWARDNWQLLTMAVPAVLVGKAGVIWLVGWLFRLPRRHAIASGLCLSQIGEFSFLLAGEAGGVLPPDGFRLVVSTTIVTLLFTPYLVSVGPRFGIWAVQHLPGGGGAKIDEEEHRRARTLKDHVIIIGFGPAGQAVCDAVRSAHIEPVVLDLNPRTIAAARADGIHARIGDASHSTVMNELHPESARAVVVTIPDHRTAVQIVHQVRLRAPQTPVFARARYHVYAPELEREGAKIVNEESQTGWRLGLAVLQDLGVRRDVDPSATE